MQKIKSLFKRDYDGNRQAYDEVVEGSEWVLEGEGVPTIKMDGTSCRYRDGRWWKRYDRKLIKKVAKKHRNRDGTCKREGGWTDDDFKPAPDGWESAEESPDRTTGHWPGWLPITDQPDAKWHVEAIISFEGEPVDGGTYELVGPKVQRNPYGLDRHYLERHGDLGGIESEVGRTFESIRAWMADNEREGIVWHHHDGRMVKCKRRDFGFDWPPAEED